MMSIHCVPKSKGLQALSHLILPKTPCGRGAVITSAFAKIALVTVTDKPQISVAQPKSCSIFARAAIQFGVSDWVARGDSETIFNTCLPRLPGNISSYLSRGRRTWRAERWRFYGSSLDRASFTSTHISLVQSHSRM